MPSQKPIGTTGGGQCPSGAANEVWSYGEEAYEIIKDLLHVRERLRPYITGLMKEAHVKGTPPMRPLFYDFHEDEHAWEVDDQYMFGPDILVAPILKEGERSRPVYLPKGADWSNPYSGQSFEGGQQITVDAPLKQIPLFLKNGADLPIVHR